MTIIHPSIYVLDFKTAGKILRINLLDKRSFRRALLTIASMSALLFVVLLNILFKMLDEIIFIGYRKTKLDQPIFIISSPRSGTSYLQSLISLDKANISTIKLYQVLFHSITLCKLFETLGTLDQFIGRPLRKMVSGINHLLFKGWKNIHKMDLDLPEEDEGFWFLSFLSPAWSMIVPFYDKLRYLDILDRREDVNHKDLSTFYLNFLKRMHYLNGPKKRLLIKSVMSSGRIEMIRSIFPMAKIISIERPLVYTVPSYISMFSRPWKAHSPDVEISCYRSLGQTVINFKRHMNRFLKDADKEKVIRITYDFLNSDPEKCISQIFEFLQILPSQKAYGEIHAAISSGKEYRSEHLYDFEQYGYKKEELTL